MTDEQMTQAVDDLFRRCPPPPLTDDQIAKVVGIIRGHYLDMPPDARRPGRASPAGSNSVDATSTSVDGTTTTATTATVAR